MVKALWETYRRRGIQDKYNKKHNIQPEKAESNIKGLDVVKTDEVLSQGFDSLTRGKTKKLKRMTKFEKEIILKDLKEQLDASISAWEFENAAVIRDQIKEISGE